MRLNFCSKNYLYFYLYNESNDRLRLYSVEKELFFNLNNSPEFKESEFDADNMACEVCQQYKEMGEDETLWSENDRNKFGLSLSAYILKTRTWKEAEKNLNEMPDVTPHLFIVMYKKQMRCFVLLHDLNPIESDIALEYINQVVAVDKSRHPEYFE